jgi:Putative Ig domain
MRQKFVNYSGGRNVAGGVAPRVKGTDPPVRRVVRGGCAVDRARRGSFPVQSTWANDFNGGAGGCEVSHAIVRNPSGNTVTVTNPGTQTTTSGMTVSLQIAATDSASGQTLTYAASGLPAGLSMSASSGLITGAPTTPATSTVSVTATDTTGAVGSTAFSWTVNPATGCTATQLIVNRGFETGSAAPWTASSAVINTNGAGETVHTGNWYAWLDGYGTTTTDTLGQTVSIPSGCTSYTFSFWLHIDSADSGSVAHDKLTVQVMSTGGTVLKTLATFSNLNEATGYVPHAYNLTAFAGQVTLKFTGAEDSSLQTSFVIDDGALNVS